MAATTGVDREASAPDAASAGTPGVHRRDRGQHQDDAAARAQPARTALARRGSAAGAGRPSSRGSDATGSPLPGW